MDPVRALARPLLASVFVVDGIDAIRHADEHVALLEPWEPLLDKVSEKVPWLPKKRATMVRLMGGVSVGAGVLLATGKAPRLAAGTLAVVAFKRTIIRYPFWSAKGEDRREKLNGFMRSGAVMAGLIFAAQDRQGKPSMAWQVQNWREHRTDLSDVKSDLEDQLRIAKAEIKAGKAELKSGIRAVQAKIS
ncbi:DoxX family protein [Ruania halotolerans]|uniref:DoxX family protein n=1 Tax=Ruania halotolerans TaxID=2897773 RepID=UPI001E648275|nr:DoxX family protein [Ruania halotolerans]UFU07625.1 DoxX family protein [Ruania halotolerans]